MSHQLTVAMRGRLQSSGHQLEIPDISVHAGRSDAPDKTVGLPADHYIIGTKRRESLKHSRLYALRYTAQALDGRAGVGSHVMILGKTVNGEVPAHSVKL